MIDLYPCFEHLKNYNNIWLYSDPHFSDPEMVHLRKNYIGDDEQIKRINSKVGKKDAIIFLGDIGNIDCIKKIRGYKILVMGNHDKGSSNYKREIIVAENNKLPKDNHLFDEVYEGIVCLNSKIVLSHEPVDIPFMFNIHGHDHSNWASSNDNLHLNLCAEHINYTPVSLLTLVKNGLCKNVESIHRTTIDQATERKLTRQLK